MEFEQNHYTKMKQYSGNFSKLLHNVCRTYYTIPNGKITEVLIDSLERYNCY